MGEQRQRYNEEFKRETVKFIQEQTKSFSELAEELDIPKSTLHQWMGQYRELKNEPVASVDRVRELEAELKEARRQLKEHQDQLADRDEELAIIKKQCTSSADQGTPIPVHEGPSLRVSLGEDVHNPTSIQERVLQVAERQTQSTRTPQGCGEGANPVPFCRPQNAVWESENHPVAAPGRLYRHGTYRECVYAANEATLGGI
nr:transposase [Paenibacillus tritici]